MGNHAQGVALSARLLGVKATVVMPELAPLTKVSATQIYDAGANIVDIHHRRSAWGVPLAYTGLEFILEVRDPEHGQRLLVELSSAGYDVSQVLPDQYAI